jgi:U3 small nucleolar RNA-associated protein 12
MKTTACIRTMDCGYAICSTFMPGDRHVRLICLLTYGVFSSTHLHSQIAIGTKSGEILIYDLASSSLIDTIKAHTASVWSLHIRPDEQALVSGSADKDVKFWEFESKDGSSDNVSASLTGGISSRQFIDWVRCRLRVGNS